MESILVGAIVAGAALWGLGRMYGRRKTQAACGSSMGCGGCSCTAKPPTDRQRLVSLRH